MAPLALTTARLAEEIGLPADTLTSLTRCRRAMSADIALRLSRRFGTSPQFWLNLQNACDLSRAEARHDYSSIRGGEAAA